MARSTKEYIGLALRGMAMGAADVVPGVSGGTIAFITGIYEELLETLSKINLGVLTTLKKDGLAAAWQQMNGTFLLVLFAGILTSIFSLAKLINFLLEFHAHLLWSFFFGLVAASIIYVGKQVNSWSTPTITGFLIGTALAYYITQLPPMGAGTELWYIFICGAIAICAMILPGISGSFILLILGAYQVVINAVSEWDFLLLGIFGLGCIAGLMSFSRLLNWMFKKHKDVTISVLTGFLLGSMSKLWPWKENVELLYTHSNGKEDWLQTNILPSEFALDPQLGFCIGLAILGFALIFGMERLAVKGE